jgi:flagellar protein FlaG
MSAETFVNALFLITAVVAAGILITAVLPIVWNMAGTFSAASHESDTRMRTDFKIVTTFAQAGTWGSGTDPKGDIYLKNIGTTPISVTEIESSDVFFGKVGEFTRLSRNIPPNPITNEQWTYEGYDGIENSYDSNKNQKWDTGETLHIIAYPKGNLASTNSLYFQFVLPNGNWRSSEIITS